MADTEHNETSADLTPGTVLSNTYEIVEYIALGGMAEVYRARNIHTDEPVAIKVVLPEFARDETRLALFRKEATVLSRLHHEAIVHYHMFTVEKETNRPYLVMEFVKGTPLSDRLKDGPLDAASTRLLIQRVATGLSAAHELGVVHRDLSPDNVVLPDGNVAKAKIIDFGIAKDAGGGTLLGGKFAGKYNFVSPEQLGLYGGEITGQSDIYSLGLIAVAALRGEALDMSGSHAEVIDKRREVPDLSTIDETIRPVIAAMLKSDPAQRPATMQAVVELLAAPPASAARPAAQAAADDPWSDPVPAASPPAAPPPSKSTVGATVIAPRPPVRTPPGGRPQSPAHGATVVTGAPVASRAGQPSAQSESPFGAFTPPPGEPPPFQAPRRPPQPAQVAPDKKARGGSSGLITLLVVLVLVLGGGGFAFTQNWFGLLGPGPVVAPPEVEVAEPEVVTDPEVITDPQPPATDPPTEVASNTASSLVPDDAEQQQPEVPQPPVTEPEPVTPPPDVQVADVEEPRSEIPPLEGVPARLAWVNAYPLGQCEFAQALAADERSMSIEAFGTQVPPFETMMIAFESENGFEPDILMRLATAAQCPAVDFLRFVKPLSETGPRLDVDRTLVERGTRLTGTLQAVAGWQTDVLLVDDAGLVHNVVVTPGASGATATFSAPLSSAALDEAPIMVIAISSRAGLVAPGSAEGMPASAVFPAILREMQQKTTNVAIGVKYVKLARR